MSKNRTRTQGYKRGRCTFLKLRFPAYVITQIQQKYIKYLGEGHACDTARLSASHPTVARSEQELRHLRGLPAARVTHHKHLFVFF